MEWLNGLVDEGQAVTKNVVVLVAMFTIGMTWFRTRALVPVVGACILAGIALFAINNSDWFEQKIGEETDRRAPLVSSLGEEAAPPPLLADAVWQS